MEGPYIAQPSYEDVRKGVQPQVHPLRIDELGRIEKTLDPGASGSVASLGSAAPAAIASERGSPAAVAKPGT
eukprot:12918288-Prorocentrum_lima.AAC.1